MRSALYKALKEIAPVYHGSYSGKVEKKPYLILSMEAEVRTRLKNLTPFSVFVYADAGDMTALDSLCGQVKKLLHKKTFKRITDDSFFIVEYEGAGSDFVEDELQAVSRQLRFSIPIFGNDFL